MRCSGEYRGVEGIAGYLAAGWAGVGCLKLVVVSDRISKPRQAITLRSYGELEEFAEAFRRLGGRGADDVLQMGQANPGSGGK